MATIGTGAEMVVQNTPLLRQLSPELRNVIYELVLIDSAPIDICTTRQQPGLVRACREIRAESLSIYYFGNTFRLRTRSEDGDQGLDRFVEWFIQIGPRNCAELRHVRVIIGDGCGLMIRDPKAASDPWCSLMARVNDFGCSNQMLIIARLCDQWGTAGDLVPSRGQANRRRSDLFCSQAREVVDGYLNYYLSILSLRYAATKPAVLGLRNIQSPEGLDEALTATRTNCLHVFWLLNRAMGRSEGQQEIPRTESEKAIRDFKEWLQRAMKKDGDTEV